MKKVMLILVVLMAGNVQGVWPGGSSGKHDEVAELKIRLTNLRCEIRALEERIEELENPTEDITCTIGTISITTDKHTVRFQGYIMVGGDVELEWDDFTLFAEEIAFDGWWENLTVKEIRENWGIDFVYRKNPKGIER